MRSVRPACVGVCLYCAAPLSLSEPAFFSSEFVCISMNNNDE